MREAILLPGARAYRALMSEAEQLEVERRINRLERDASVDNRTTFAIPGTSELFLYEDGLWRMTYATPDAATIVVRSIAHALDLPN